MTIKSLIGAGVLALLGWLILSITVLLLSPQSAPAARILFPSKSFIASLSDDGILAHDAISITLAMTNRTPIDLYRAGAFVVFPAGLQGCLPDPKTPALIGAQGRVKS